jgi:hypothetical protein
MLQVQDHRGYKLVQRSRDLSDSVKVYDKRYPRDPEIYAASSFEDALSWVDAYLKGEHWAVVSKKAT